MKKSEILDYSSPQLRDSISHGWALSGVRTPRSGSLVGVTRPEQIDVGTVISVERIEPRGHEEAAIQRGFSRDLSIDSTQNIALLEQGYRPRICRERDPEVPDHRCGLIEPLMGNERFCKRPDPLVIDLCMRKESSHLPSLQKPHFIH